MGVDGGDSYSAAFSDLSDLTLLSNGQKTFDLQFLEFPGILNRTRIDFAPLDIECPIRVFVAGTESEQLPTKVLEYSIRKHCSMSVVVSCLQDSGIDIPRPQTPENQPRTPFSFQRFTIPQAAGRRGRAIYLDSDMQLFQDIRALWTYPMDSAEIVTVIEPSSSGRRPQFSVMLLDCERLAWSIEEIVQRLDCGALTYESLMYNMAAGGRVLRIIDPIWNSLERYIPGKTALLHYTDMHTQPWVSRRNALGYLWVRDLLDAISEGFITREFVAEHVAKGWIRPSLLLQIDSNVGDPLLLGARGANLDRGFVAPYRRLPKRSTTWTNPMTVVRALGREIFDRHTLPAMIRLITRLRR